MKSKNFYLRCALSLVILMMVVIATYILLERVYNDLYPLKNSLFFVGIFVFLYSLMKITKAANIFNLIIFAFKRKEKDETYVDYNAKKLSVKTPPMMWFLFATSIVLIIVSILI